MDEGEKLEREDQVKGEEEVMDRILAERAKIRVIKRVEWKPHTIEIP